MPDASLTPLAPTANELALAWLGFVALLATALCAIPLAAGAVRLFLPRSRRPRILLESFAYAFSPRAQGSPRQPVRMHRTLLATALLAVPALLVLVGVGIVRSEGPAAVEGALALAVPILLVMLHARRRSASS